MTFMGLCVVYDDPGYASSLQFLVAPGLPCLDGLGAEDAVYGHAEELLHCLGGRRTSVSVNCGADLFLYGLDGDRTEDTVLFCAKEMLCGSCGLVAPDTVYSEFVF